MGAFLDTGIFLGFLHRKDANHISCKNKFVKISSGNFGLIFTSSYVISETATIILLRTHNNMATLKAFWDLIYGDRKFIRIVESNSHRNKLAWNIFIAHNQKAKTKKNFLSFVDASNIAICREIGISNILAVDGDFDGYLTLL
ncbi:MAG: type II toxin-antitoxin system VapC family toxin [Promethearchaeota archaeon]